MNIPSNEVRSKIYGRLSNNKEEYKELLNTGLTSDYKQMLMDGRKYYVTKGLSANQVDLDKQVVLGHHPSQRNIPYTYGEINTEDILAQRAR